MSSATTRLQVKVVPGSSRDVVVGWLGDALKIKVAVAPEKGKANRAVCALLAETLEIPMAKIKVVAGQTAANKTLEITGLSRPQILAKLADNFKGAGDGI